MVDLRMADKNDGEIVFEFFKDLTLFHLKGFNGVLKLKEYEEERTTKKIQEYLSKENAGIIIAEKDKTPVGVLGYYIESYGELSNFDYDRYLLIDRVIVSDGFRGENIGQALVEEAERLALKMGIKRIELELGVFNTKAEKFYDRMGYNCYMKLFAKDI